MVLAFNLTWNADHFSAAATRDVSEGVRVAYVAATRARDLLVVPVLGIDRMSGWLGPLNKAVYPKREEYRTRRTPRGCPSFGMSTLLAGPENQIICPGIHQPEVGSHEVAWWDPAHCDWMLMPNRDCEL
jgi:ATP-dependent helicase/nuclease subunit A